MGSGSHVSRGRQNPLGLGLDPGCSRVGAGQPLIGLESERLGDQVLASEGIYGGNLTCAVRVRLAVSCVSTPEGQIPPAVHRRLASPTHPWCVFLPLVSGVTESPAQVGSVLHFSLRLSQLQSGFHLSVPHKLLLGGAPNPATFLGPHLA